MLTRFTKGRKVMIHAKHNPKHKLEKWFIISGDGVRPSLQFIRTYVQNTPIQELNHFSSKCFGWCLGLDHCTTTQVLCRVLFLELTLASSTSLLALLCDLSQQEKRKPPQPLFVEPPLSQQNKKNSQAPVSHWC